MIFNLVPAKDNQAAFGVTLWVIFLYSLQFIGIANKVHIRNLPVMQYKNLAGD